MVNHPDHHVPELWDWLVWRNPLGQMVLGSRHLTHDERADGHGTATLTTPTNIGVGTT